MNVKSRRRFSPEFKAQALELVALGKPVDVVARELEVGPDLIYSWRRKAEKQTQLVCGVEGAVGDRSAADELRLLRRQVANLQIENDILKKAAIILGTSNPPKKGGS
ncbi:transposase [Roseibacillus persicicus]|uniref:Transposase n=1 Tax=Roseibacillus persicicus TaxID=454148 RepID=A0A918WR06_9BACT|nr:transposase [Roseibacillus persicicus]GHC68726.1 transposase [Roseibacillus persicicus]